MQLAPGAGQRGASPPKRPATAAAAAPGAGAAGVQAGAGANGRPGSEAATVAGVGAERSAADMQGSPHGSGERKVRVTPDTGVPIGAPTRPEALSPALQSRQMFVAASHRDGLNQVVKVPLHYRIAPFYDRTPVGLPGRQVRASIGPGYWLQGTEQGALNGWALRNPEVPGELRVVL